MSLKMFTFGPFRISDVEALQSVLDQAGATYELFADEEERDQAMKRFNEEASKNPRAMAGGLDLRYIFLEIAPDEFEKAKGELEKFGITKPSDGSWELSDEEEAN
jgi:hypothetical protein